MGRIICVTAICLLMGAAGASEAAPRDEQSWKTIGGALQRRIIVYGEFRLWDGRLRELRPDSLVVETARGPVVVSSDLVCFVAAPAATLPGVVAKQLIMVAGAAVFGWLSFRCDECHGKVRVIGAFLGAAAAICPASLLGKGYRTLYRSPSGCQFMPQRPDTSR